MVCATFLYRLLYSKLLAHYDMEMSDPVNDLVLAGSRIAHRDFIRRPNQM